MTPVITDPDILQGYLSDASNTHGSAVALVRPNDTAEVAEVLKHCQQEQIPLTITAQRTSTTGAPVPHGGWLLSTENLTHRPDDRTFGAGWILGQLQAELEQQGLSFPPDPTSRHECSLGAAIACNASGARSFRFGPIRSWVEAIEFVTPTGEVLQADRDTPIPKDWPVPQWIEPEVKTAAGYVPADNLLDLMIGQEGTLGVITTAKLKVVPMPRAILTMLVFFPSRESCLSFLEVARAGAARQGGTGEPGALNPSALEYYDHLALQRIRAQVPDVPDEATDALCIDVDHDGEPPLDQWWDALEEHGALLDSIIAAEDADGIERLRQARHAVPASINEDLIRAGMPKVGTDFSVPDDALSEMMAAYDAIPLRRVTFGHIGDNHLHVNMLPQNEAELRQAKGIYRQLALKAVSLGGTVSAEHGIGKIKRDLLAEMVGPEVTQAFRQLKQAVDPNWILGQGTVLSPP